MKKILSLLALASVSLVSADPYYQGYSSYPNDGRYYQDSNANYYQQSGETYQRPQETYYQRNDQNYQQNTPSYQQQSSRNQQYYQPTTQYDSQPQNSRNQQYYQQSGNNSSYSTTQSDNYSESDLQKSEKKYPQDSASNAQDRQINAKIRNKLGSGWFSKGYETLILRTSNGIVVITGAVEKSDDVEKINDHIKGIDGIKSVNNQVNVKKK